MIHETDRDATEISYLEMRSGIECVDDGESYQSVGAETPNIGRSTFMIIYKNEDRRAWYLDAEATDGRVDQVLANATDRR